MTETAQNVEIEQCRKIGAKALRDLPGLIDDDKLTEWFFQFFYGGQASCFRCGAELSERSRRSFLDGRAASCRACGKQNRFFGNTFLAGIKTKSTTNFLLVAALLTAGASSRDIAEATTIPLSTVRMWQKKINPEPTA